MNKNLPTKWVRKAIFEAIDGINVDGFTINCYDTNVTGAEQPDHYVLVTTQTNETDKNNKCEWFWNSTATLDIVTYYPRPGNPGSRLLADNITDAVRQYTNNLVLDTESDLEIFVQTFDVLQNLTMSTDEENIFRNIVQLTFRIK